MQTICGSHGISCHFGRCGASTKSGLTVRTWFVASPSCIQRRIVPRFFYVGVWHVVTAALRENRCVFKVHNFKAHRKLEDAEVENLKGFFGRDSIDEWAKKGSAGRNEAWWDVANAAGGQPQKGCWLVASGQTAGLRARFRVRQTVMGVDLGGARSMA